METSGVLGQHCWVETLVFHSSKDMGLGANIRGIVLASPVEGHEFHAQLYNYSTKTKHVDMCYKVGGKVKWL